MSHSSTSTQRTRPGNSDMREFFAPTNTSSEETFKGKLPGIIDDVHYSFVGEESGAGGVKVILAKCLNCPEDDKRNTIRGDSRTQANFIRHLKRKHVAVRDEYVRSTVKRAAPLTPSQRTLSHMRTGVTSGKQKKVEAKIIKFIVNGMKPLSTVDEPAFKELMKEISTLNGEKEPVKIMSRSTLTKKIDALYLEIVKTLREKINEAPYLCLTADAWSAHSRAFLGVTCHWITRDLKRDSAVLACSRFTGVHSFDRIANELNKIILKFNIPKEKIVSIVTDNGSNFVKAFREFGISSMEELKPGELPESDEDKERDEGCDSDNEDSGRNDQVVEIEIDGILHDKRMLGLPPHFKCASHTLSLIATKDILEANDKGLYHRVIGKCTKLWNLCSSPKSAEKIVNIAGKNFKRPCKTRWNSLFDSIQRVLNMKDSLRAICEDLSVPEFSEKELEFLEEFYKVSKPIAYALDLLQGEVGLYMGVTLPALINMKRMLNSMSNETKYCNKFVQASLAGIDKRFRNLLEWNSTSPSDLVFAAMSHPSFKLKWVPADEHENLKKMFVVELAKYLPGEIEIPNVIDSSDIDTAINPLLDFLSVASSSAVHTSVKYDVEMECIRFLNDPRTNLEMLNDYPMVLKAFFRYNTALPSSAPVERLFSYAGLVLTPRLCSLSDQTFEKLVLLKCNSNFQP